VDNLPPADAAILTLPKDAYWELESAVPAGEEPHR